MSMESKMSELCSKNESGAVGQQKARTTSWQAMQGPEKMC